VGSKAVGIEDGNGVWCEGGSVSERVRSLINLCDCMDALSVRVLEGSWIVRMPSLRLRRY